jgi:3-dehydroquinate dehydratase/shikimate dehydrogenase
MEASTVTYAPRPLPLRLPRVCVAVTGSDAAELIAKAEALVRDNPLIELRLDYLRRPGLAYPKIKRLLEFHPYAVLIATCRRAVNGGKFRGTAAGQVDILIKAAVNGCQLVDLEYESASKLKRSELEKIRRHARLMISFHDFRGTRKLEDTLKKLTSLPGDYFKIVTTATRLSDNVTMMKFLQRWGEQYPLIGLCMGEQGIISRILGVRAGSVFTFAAATKGEETAPGQIAARTLRDTYRVDTVDAATRVYGVAGDPISHSLSPAMLNAAFRRENVNGVYLALHAKELDDLLACVRDIPIHGLSVTMPYKEAIVEYLDNTDPIAAKVGAVNTVIRSQDGKLYGFNTDVSGIIRPIEQRMSIPGAKVLVVGAGGAARAAVFGLKDRGAEVYVFNRTPGAAQRLAKQARARFASKGDLKKLQVDVIVNATPAGMANGRAPAALDDKDMNARYLLEMVYRPSETKLVKMARAKGIHIIPGTEMFVYQGARQFEIWTGKPAPLDDMMNVVQRALAEEAAAKASTNGTKKKRR